MQVGDQGQQGGELMRSKVECLRRCGTRGVLGAVIAVAALAASGAPATAQTYGLATMQPGTLAHTVASAIAKTLKEKGGLNTLVQNTAGESVLIPMVAKGEIDLGMANMLEVVEGIETGKLENDLRIIGSIYVLRMGFFARKDSGIVTMADVKGKRVPAGYSAMRTLDKNTQAMLATAGLTLSDVKPVMVPNVLRGGDDFMAGSNDMFMFSFGGPKVREADPGLCRCVRADEGLRDGLHPVHQRQDQERDGREDHRHHGQQQGRHGG